MTVYVTELRSEPGRASRYAQLAADSSRELTAAAAALGLHPGRLVDATATTRAFYRVTAAQREAAMTGGARRVRALPTPADAAAGPGDAAVTRWKPGPQTGRQRKTLAREGHQTADGSPTYATATAGKIHPDKESR